MGVPGKLPTGGGQGSVDTHAEQVWTIGQVVQELQADFPELSISKVRYLEDRGLLSPARSQGRYRKYTGADVRRLRTILALQRDEYLPLEVIKERVDRVGAAGAGPGVPPTGMRLGGGRTLRREEPLYTARGVCEMVGVDQAFLQALIEYRLIERPEPPGAVFYGDSDVETVRICHLLSRFRVEPRNLRLLSSSAEREAALIEQVATTALRSTHADKREYGVRVLEDLGALVSSLTHLLLYRELGRLL